MLYIQWAGLFFSGKLGFFSGKPGFLYSKLGFFWASVRD